MLALKAVLLGLVCSAAADAAPINPTPRSVLGETAQRWTFDRDTEGWAEQHNCTVSADEGSLRVRATGLDPYFHRPLDLPGGRFALKIRARCRAVGPGTVYWTTNLSPQAGEDKVVALNLKHDGQWRDYTVRFNAPGRLINLRIDPGQDAGQFDVDSIELIREEPHPLTIDRADFADAEVRFTVRNHAQTPVEFTADGKAHTIQGKATMSIVVPTPRTAPLEAVSLELVPKRRFPPTRRTVFLHHPSVQTDWITRPLDQFVVQIARDGSVARVLRQEKLVAFLGPIVHCDGRIPKLKLLDTGPTLRFRGEGIGVAISTAQQELTVSIESTRPCEGPVVRVVGSMQQGLFAGIEHLGENETSSSTLDCETPEHIRFAPDPLKVTMPLMAIVTDRASVALTWQDMQLQPVFAAPNFFDCTDDRRMALRGRKIDARIRFGQSSLEEVILQFVKRTGLPALPEPPRTVQEQKVICLAALDGPLRTAEGWGHCVQPRWKRQPFADMASTMWRLSGEIPEMPRLVHGGAHVPNGSIYFVTGRADQWLAHQKAAVTATMRRQQADGSFRNDGPYRRGHFENTASGACARPAAVMLEYARVTGDREALAAGVRTLDYMMRFHTPRGAQVWEIPLHTPDQLASAYLVWAYVRGYELTGNEKYLAAARKWAASGIPFVYLWSEHPVMLYATPPVLGATNWKAPMWIGLPVQWVGGVYAYALTMLAPHDDSLDWNHLARGILISGEQQQYPDGDYRGLLPDSFALATQQRRPADINPCALASLRMVLDGELDFLSVAIEGNHRIAAPFPVTIREGKAHIRAKAGVAYQVIVDGSQIVDIKSQGDDVLPLED